MGNETISAIEVLYILGGILNLSSFLIALQCVLSILSVSTTRTSSFNIYIVAVLLPDIVVNLCNAVTAGVLLGQANAYTISLCALRNISMLFNFFSNLHLNAVIARETFRLMQDSYHRRRVHQPEMRKTALQIGCVYLLSISYAIWASIEISSSPFHVSNVAHCQFLPGSPGHENGDGIFSPLVAGCLHGFVFTPPLVYVLYVYVVVKRRRLMPIKGRTRAVALYFFRIAVVFLCFYFPILILGFISFFFVEETSTDESSTLVGFWLPWLVTQLMAFQLLVTVRMVLEKDDVREAVFDKTKGSWNLSILVSIIRMLYNCGRVNNRIDASATTPESTTETNEESGPTTNEDRLRDLARRTSQWELDDLYSCNSLPAAGEILPSRNIEAVGGGYADSASRAIDLGRIEGSVPSTRQSVSIGMDGQIRKVSNGDDQA